MQRQEFISMLAKKRSICLNNNLVARTPLLVPSFSSMAMHQTKNFPNLLKLMEEVITGPILISAYDIYYKYINLPINFPELIFIDSGGYESAKNSEFSDLGYTVHEPNPWNKEFHQSVIDNWHSEIPTVVVSYDHPERRLSLKEQIANANELFATKKGTIREILIKPETKKQNYIQLNSVLNNIRLLKSFDIVGFTEKELGNSLFKRMINIAYIRKALQKAKLSCAIQIFGSLDPVTTPLYFLAGADIFDGLTWVRFSFFKGYTIYKLSGGALQFEIKAKDNLVEGRILYNNCYQLEKLSNNMQRFLQTQDFKSFECHTHFFRTSYELLIEELKED